MQQISMGTGYLAVDGEFVLDVQELLNRYASAWRDAHGPFADASLQ